MAQTRKEREIKVKEQHHQNHLFGIFSSCLNQNKNNCSNGDGKIYGDTNKNQGKDNQPPSPTQPCQHQLEKKSRKKSSGEKNKDDHALHSPASSYPSAPPPQHSSFFYNLFRKRSRSKRIHSSTPPTSPSKKVITTLPYWENNSFSEEEDDLPSGCQSPPTPRRPPPPPLRIGDFSDTEDAEISMTCGGLSPLNFSPSADPNVDSKADGFIAQFHERMREENLNFSRKKERTRMERACTI